MPEVPSWRERLKEIRRRSTRVYRRREIFYHLNAFTSEQYNLLTLDLKQREARKDGRLGSKKVLKINEKEARELPNPVDREVLSLLLAVASTEGFATRYASWGDGARRRFSEVVVPASLYSLVLPKLCATGRVFSHDRTSHDLYPVSWQELPWRFVLEVERNEELGQGRLAGRLERGGEKRALDEVDLLLTSGLVLGDRRLAPLEAGLSDAEAAAPWIETLLREGDVALPVDELPELVSEIWRLPDLPSIELPADLQLESVRVAPTRRLAIDMPPSGPWRAKATFDYDGVEVVVGEPPGEINDRARRRRLVRDMDLERVAGEQLLDVGFQTTPRLGHYDLGVRMFLPAVRPLLDSGWVVEMSGKRVRLARTQSFSIQTSIDWFELHGEVDFEGHGAGMPELLRAARSSKRFVRLGDGSLGVLPEEWLERFERLERLVGKGEMAEDGGDGSVRFLPSQAGLLEALLEAQDAELDVDAEFAEFRAKLRSFDGIAPAEESEGFQGTLRGYQRDGLGWLGFLQALSIGGCLADDMGLGKTVQVLAHLERQHEKGPGASHRPSLIVVPRSLIHNWTEEAARFTPKLRVLDYSGPDRARSRGRFREHDLVLTTYGVLRLDAPRLAKIHFNYVVLDEAQAIKNPKSQAALASKLLRARQRLVLTGTPVENHLGELASLFGFLNPGMLGRFTSMLHRSDDTAGDPAIRRVMTALRPFILRRTKKEVLKDLPEKTEQTLYCDFSDEERRLYDELREHYRLELDKSLTAVGLGASKLQVLEALLRLRQSACHPGLIDQRRWGETSAKLELLLGQVEEVRAEGHKVLVFSQFTKLLGIVRRHLEDRSLVYEYLDGKTRDRKKRVERFQSDPDCGVFLISIKAGGVGLNLTAADYVFVLDPWWNPAVEAQAVDRAHRIGQTQPVFAYRLVVRGTVEEKILQLQKGKRELADAILTADRSLMRNLKPEDLELLLGS